MIDAFVSIINGIKSPRPYIQGNAAPNNAQDQNELAFKSVQNMFYYLEGIMNLDDLQLNSDLAIQILDLYCDIVMLNI